MEKGKGRKREGTGLGAGVGIRRSQIAEQGGEDLHVKMHVTDGVRTIKQREGHLLWVYQNPI